MPPKTSKKKAVTKAKGKASKKASKKKVTKGKNEMKLSLAKLTPVTVPREHKHEYKVAESPYKGPAPLLDAFNPGKLPKDGKKDVYKEDTIVLPPSLAQEFKSWKRVTDITDVDPKLMEVFIPLGESDKRICNAIYPTTSKWSQQVAAVLNMLINLGDERIIPPWDLIYPRDKTGAPKFSERGRYSVKMFVQSEWKLVSIDDRVPVNAEGKCLYPTSYNPLEVWPQLITKALNKVYPVTQWTDEGASIVYALTGNMIHDLPTQPSPLMLQSNFTWPQLLNNPESEVMCGIISSTEPLEWPECPIVSTLPIQHPLRPDDRPIISIPEPEPLSAGKGGNKKEQKSKNDDKQKQKEKEKEAEQKAEVPVSPKPEEEVSDIYIYTTLHQLMLSHHIYLLLIHPSVMYMYINIDFIPIFANASRPQRRQNLNPWSISSWWSHSSLCLS